MPFPPSNLGRETQTSGAWQGTGKKPTCEVPGVSFPVEHFCIKEGVFGYPRRSRVIGGPGYAQ